MKNETQRKSLFGICQWSIPYMEPNVTTRTLVELGLDGIELNAGNWNGTQLSLADNGLQQQWLEACDKHSIQIPALGVDILGIEGMSKPNKKEIVKAILANGVEIAQTMKIPVLKLPSFFDGAIKTDRDLETTVARLREVCDLAEAQSIIVGTENALTVESCLKLITLTDRENLKVFFDTQNPWAMEGINVSEILKGEYAHLCNAVHVKDGLGDNLSSALLGEGDSEFEKTMSVFVENKYAGWFILENDYRNIPDSANWKTNVKTDSASLRVILG